MTLVDYLTWALVAAGLGQFILCAASPFIPVVLKWPEQLRGPEPLRKQE